MKKKINFEPKLNLARKISIKALDFEKLPKKLVGSNYKANTFLNITRSSSNLCIEGLPSSLSKQNKKTYFVKPMTSRSRNDNAIRLNEIPKTSYINVTPVQKMKQLTRNKNLNNIFTQSIYQSYHNNQKSSAKCITFNTNNKNNNINNNNKNSITNHFGQFLNKMSASKGSSRNMSNPNLLLNNNTYSLKIRNKDNINSTIGSNNIHKFSNNNTNLSNVNNINNSNHCSHERINGSKNSAPKNLLINGYKSNSNGKNFRGTISNFGSLSYKKFGIKVRKKKLLNGMNEEPFLKDKINKLLNLPLFKNFEKLQILVLWRKFNNENTKRYKMYYLNEFLNKRIINYYYKNKLIGQYNQIKKEEKIWNNLSFLPNNLEVNEKNKGSVLITLSEQANITIQKVFFTNTRKYYNHLILRSASLYIYELMINQIFTALSKITYVFKYYYDEAKKAIIKKPSATELKGLLLNINRIIEKPNITNKTFQNFIINLSKFITNLNLNKMQAKPIVAQYLDLYRGVNNINYNDIKKYFQFGNIYNDFSSLQIKDTNFIINEIKNTLKECENQLFKYYLVQDINDNDNFFILLYKMQPIKSKIMSIDENFKNLVNKKDKAIINNIDTINDIQKKIDGLKDNLKDIVIEIENKYNDDLISGKSQDIKIIIPYLMYQLVKNNIIYKNLFEGFSLLETNKNYLSLKKNKDIYNSYKKLYNNGYINFDCIIYLCLYDKYSKYLEQQINEDLNKNINLLYKILIYVDEMNTIYSKINIFDDNKLNKKINILQNNLNKNNEKIEQLKKIINNNNNKKNKLKKNNNNNINELYQEIISNYIKYDINKKNNNDTIQNTSNLEKMLFKQLTNIKNNSNNYYINNKNKQKEILVKVNNFIETGDTKIIKELSQENKYSRKYLSPPDKNKKKEVTYPYPRLLFLSEKELSSILMTDKISLTDITKYFNIIHPGQELEIKGITMNKNIIMGIQIVDQNKKESELFKLCNPINIPTQNKSNKNTLYYLSILYKNVNTEIESSLTKQLMQSLSLFSKKEFHEWANSTFNQITICTLCLIFTHEISKLLVSDNKNKNKLIMKDYKLINEKYNNFVSDECILINNIKNRINVVLTLISQMNIVESLMKNDVQDINSFNWLKYIRHLWDKNKRAVIIECGGWANYQMKKLNKYRYRLLLSPDTDKIFLFNSSCFREKSASIIKVINNKYNNNSYKEIFDEYCSLFWTDMINVNAVVTPNNEMKKIFDICTTNCSWIYIDNLDLFKYNNDDNYINNLIYFSKFIQTIQQEVILNDIKSNEGEKMFCLMGCLNVDDNIKMKSECLKGSSRILNFIKPDIDFYLNISFKIYKNSNKYTNNDRTNKKLTDILLKKEQIIRDKLKGFYFDFDYFNEFLIYILQSKAHNLISSDDKLENIFISFIDSYSNRFLGKNENNAIDENIINKYFENRNIIMDNERLQFIKYLYYITQNKFLKKNILLKGYSRHYMINVFKNFYFYQTSQKLSEVNNIINENINIIYYEKKEENDTNLKKYNENIKIFEFPAPKNKVLLKIFIEEITYKLKKMNYLLNEKYQSKLIEYIFKVIKSNSNNTIFYRTLCNFKNWMNKFIEMIEINKKKMTDIILYNIINESLIISLGHENNIIKTISDTSKENIDSNISKQLFDNMNINSKKNENKYFYFDLDRLAFRNFANNFDYIKSYKEYIDNSILNNTKIIYIFSEFFANKYGEEINRLFEYDNTKIFVTDEIDKLYNNSNYSNYSQYLKIFIGYDQSYTSKDTNAIINITAISKNLGVSKILEKIKINSICTAKYLYFLSMFNIKNYSNDEIMFIYSAFDCNYKEVYDDKNINRPLNIIKNIFSVFPKANYYINVNNKLLKYLLKNDILIGASSIIFNVNKNNNNNIFKSNNIYFNLTNDICIKIVKELLYDIINKNIQYKYLMNILKKSNNKSDEFDYNFIEDNELILISKMINDLYNIPSESSFNEKYQNNQENLDMFKKIFYLLGITPKKIIKDNYYNCRIITQVIKYGNIKDDSLNYKCLSCISDIFNNNNSKINDISILINEIMTNYKELITNKKEYINSKYYFFKQMKISSQTKENIYNSILEKIYLSLSNHFLFSLLFTLEIMLNNFEISLFEKEFLLNYLKQNYIFPSNNTIKYKYETESDNIKYNYIKENGKKLIEFYTQKSKSGNNNYLTLLTKSLDNMNNKYYYTSSLKKIERDIDKLLYYITFVPEQSSSMFKYVINKYLLKIISFSKFNINDALRKPTTKDNLVPITVNSFPSINIINFLCSLSAYYEINFYIVRNGNIYENHIIDNINYGYQNLVDGGLIDLIKESLRKGHWILIAEKIDIIKFMKIMWELYSNINDIVINKNFKIFFDEKLIEDNCQKAIENNTMIVNINYENVDDLEAAHDIWVNVLEEKLLTDSVMNQTQKDVLDILEDSSDDKTDLIGHSINHTGENKNTNINNMGNSIVSVKSIYNNTSMNHGNGYTNNKYTKNNNLSEITNWTFLQNI